MEVLFTKRLSKTDIKNRLAVPSEHLWVFGIPEGRNSIEFEVIDSTRRPWSFRLSIRTQGRYAKPVVSKGWMQFVREKGLMVNDKVTFYLEANEANGLRFRIQVEKRPFLLFGHNLRASPITFEG